MDLLTLIGLAASIYLLVYYIGLSFVDCDLGLAWAEKYGVPVGALRGKVVWITGASSGIGENLAVDLARNGVKLALSARRDDELKRVKQLCIDASGGSLKSDDVLILPLDVTAYDKHQQTFDKVLEHFGKLDILVNNAGRSSQIALWEKIDLEVDRQMFELNVFSTLSLSRVVMRHFLDRGEGHIAVMSSVTDFVGMSASCTGSKHALQGYYNCLRAEKLDKNINVTILCPCPFFTNFTAKPDQKFGESVKARDPRMTAERCGHLCAVSLANKLHEAWIIQPPLLSQTYISVYYPNFKRLIYKAMDSSFFMKLRDSRESVKNKIYKAMGASFFMKLRDSRESVKNK